MVIYMKIWKEPVEFDWDEGNIGKNLKHNIEDKETEEVFNNKPFLGSKDKKHSISETRLQALGKTNDEKLLFVSFTIRGDKVRIISVRNMNKKERSVYEKA